MQTKQVFSSGAYRGNHCCGSGKNHMSVMTKNAMCAYKNMRQDAMVRALANCIFNGTQGVWNEVCPFLDDRLTCLFTIFFFIIIRE